MQEPEFKTADYTESADGGTQSTQQNGRAQCLVDDGDLRKFLDANHHQIVQIEKSLGKSGAHHVALEGGHIYTNEKPDLRHIFELKQTALMREHLLRIGLRVTNLLFVDDYHPAPEDDTLDVDAYRNLALKMGWPINIVQSERSMLPVANVMIGILRQMGKVVPHGEKGALLAHHARKVELLGKNNGAPTCAMLDAALSTIKFGQLGADAIINVLPRGYKGQQRNTRDILRASRESNIEGIPEQEGLPFNNLFLTPDGRIRAGRPQQFS